MVEVLSGGNANSLNVDENEGGADQGDYKVVIAVVELAQWGGKHRNDLPWQMACWLVHWLIVQTFHYSEIFSRYKSNKWLDIPWILVDISTDPKFFHRKLSHRVESSVSSFLSIQFRKSFIHIFDVMSLQQYKTRLSKRLRILRIRMRPYPGAATQILFENNQLFRRLPTLVLVHFRNRQMYHYQLCDVWLITH